MRRILIVDDNPPWREAVRRNLEFMDYAVLEADNSSQALLELRRSQPSVVITDLSMNTRSEGLELITAIKEQYPQIPVILISAVGTFEEGAQARQLGAIAVLGKTRIDREMETLYSTLDEVFALQETVARLRSLARRYLGGELDTFPARELGALSRTAGGSCAFSARGRKGLPARRCRISTRNTPAAASASPGVNSTQRDERGRSRPISATSMRSRPPVAAAIAASAAAPRPGVAGRNSGE